MRRKQRLRDGRDASAAAPAENSRCAPPLRRRAAVAASVMARADQRAVALSVVGHDGDHPPAHDGVILDLLEHEFLQRQADDGDHGDAGQHDVGVEEFARAEDQPAEAPGHGGEHFDRHQNAPGLRQAEPQPGEDIGQRAGQDDVAEQPAVVGAHRLRRAHPDFLHGFDAGPAVEDDRERRHEADQQHGGDVAEAEPQQEQRRIGEAGDRRADAHQRQQNVLGPPRAAHQHADGDAENGGEREAREQAEHGLDGVMRQDAGDRELHERDSATSSSVGNSRCGNTPAQATISQIAPTTTNGNTLRAIAAQPVAGAVLSGRSAARPGDWRW